MNFNRNQNNPVIALHGAGSMGCSIAAIESERFSLTV